LRSRIRISAWGIAASIILLGILLLSTTYFLSRPKLIIDMKVGTSINLTLNYGSSKVSEQNSTQAQILSNGNSFTSIEVKVTTNTTLPIIQDLNNTVQVLFDYNIKKQVNLTLSADRSSKTIGTIQVTSKEIEEWDASQNATHTLIFQVPESNIKTSNSFQDTKILLKSSTKILRIIVSPQPKLKSPNYTIFNSGPDYVTKDSIGDTIYVGSSGSSAIQKAFDSVKPGQTILIKSAIYPITDTLTLTEDNVTITGEKYTILQASADVGRIFLFTGTSTRHATGLTLNNLTFDCALTADGPRIKWCDRVTIIGVEIENTRKAQYINGLEIQGTSGSVITGATITDCYIHNIYGSGISITYSNDFTINNNTFVDCAQFYPSGGAIHADDGCQRITVQNNHISGRSDNDGIYLGTSRSFASGCIVTGNTINLRLYGSGGGAAFAGSGIKIYTLNSLVSRNTINWNDMPYVYGIEDWGRGNNIQDNIITNAHVGIGDFTDYYNTGNNRIVNNKISFSDNGIIVHQKGSVISKNILKGTTNDGIIVYGANTEIDNNSITNCGQDSNYYGMRIEYGANNCNLYNNTITSNTGSLGINDSANGTTYKKP
jgi:hypothetical protein